MINSIQKILGQSAPIAAQNTSIYTVPSSAQVLFSVVACNRSTADTIRIALLASGDTIATKHYILYDYSLAVGSMIQITDLYMNSGDQIVVYSLNGTSSFTATGEEINRSRMVMNE